MFYVNACLSHHHHTFLNGQRNPFVMVSSARKTVLASADGSKNLKPLPVTKGRMWETKLNTELEKLKEVTERGNNILKEQKEIKGQ